MKKLLIIATVLLLGILCSCYNNDPSPVEPVLQDGEWTGSTQMTAALDTPPYYAIRVTPAIHHTMGGIHVDADMHVLRSDDTPVPGLFAAGEVTGGVHGANRLGGNGVADIVVNGKIAGNGAALICKSSAE